MDAPRVLVVRTDRLGETLLTLPVLHALRHAQPRAHLMMCVQEPLQALVANDTQIDEIVVEPRGGGLWWRRARQLGRCWRSCRPDAVLIANPKKESHLAAWLARIPIRVGYDHKWSWALTHRIADRKAVGDRHEVDYNLDLVRALGLSVSSPPTVELSVRPEDADRLRRQVERLGLADGDRLVVVHPWASASAKQWPVDRFRALMDRLRQQEGVVIAVIGGPEERRAASALVDHAGSPRVLNLVGRLTLGELAALFRRATVLVSNDSGPVHLAAAVGTSTVVLFGTSDPARGPSRWGPRGSQHTVIWKPAIEAIEVEEVVGAVQRYLGSQNSVGSRRWRPSAS